VVYAGGAILFGIALLRAHVLSRGAAILLIAAAVATPIAGLLLPHAVERLAAIPMGMALIWLGYSLWSAQRKGAAHPLPDSRSSLLDPTPVIGPNQAHSHWRGGGER
jgi:purine-cytosine permease-like protein